MFDIVQHYQLLIVSCDMGLEAEAEKEEENLYFSSAHRHTALLMFFI